MEKVYTIEDLKNANLIVRNEYEGKFIELQSQIKDLQAVISILSSKVESLSSANRGISQLQEPRDTPAGFMHVDQDGLKALQKIYDSEVISDWERDFVDSIITYQRVSEKQKPILMKIADKVASSRN